MQINAHVADDQGKQVPDCFLEFFSNPNKADDQANASLHAKVLEAVKKNSQGEALAAPQHHAYLLQPNLFMTNASCAPLRPHISQSSLEMTRKTLRIEDWRSQQLLS